MIELIGNVFFYIMYVLQCYHTYARVCVCVLWVYMFVYLCVIIISFHLFSLSVYLSLHLSPQCRFFQITLFLLFLLLLPPPLTLPFLSVSLPSPILPLSFLPFVISPLPSSFSFSTHQASTRRGQRPAVRGWEEDGEGPVQNLRLVLAEPPVLLRLSVAHTNCQLETAAIEAGSCMLRYASFPSTTIFVLESNTRMNAKT